jgi:CCR4-NOT transcription complex subunit 1
MLEPIFTVAQGWSAFHQHCLSLFRFLAPFLKDSNLKHAVKDLYRGALRILLVLLHDFPEFLSEYYFSLCDAIPPRCLQLRNIILSAFPPSVVLTDPYLPRPAELSPETGPIPFILSDFSAALKQGDLRINLDQYLLGRGSATFLTSLKDEIKVTLPDGTSDTYNISRLNSLVLYIGVSSVSQAKARRGSALFVASDPGVVALQSLASHLDVEGVFNYYRLIPLLKDIRPTSSSYLYRNESSLP